MDIQILREKVVEAFKGHHTPAHGITHVLRVAHNARVLAEKEGYDVIEAESAGLLHDMGRTLTDSDEEHAEAGMSLVTELLDAMDFPEDARQRIISAIEQHSKKQSEGELAHILQDADKLDGLGAIGIQRAYVSKYFLPEYTDTITFEGEATRNFRSLSEVVAFQLEWFNMLYTDTAKAIAAPRIEYMRSFVAELEREIIESIDTV